MFSTIKPRRLTKSNENNCRWCGLRCSESDFLLLVCDGVSEGSFPNADVVKLVASMRGGLENGEEKSF